MLRGWRRRRHLSQLELALEAGVSTRHLSFVETGRARPSAAMVLRLAEQLEVPLRERNDLLLAAGYAPAYGAARTSTTPEMGPARARRSSTVLRGHEPLPGARRWTATGSCVAGNSSPSALLAEGMVAAPAGAAGQRPARRRCIPEGVAPRIVNLAELRAHLLEQARPPGRRAAATRRSPTLPRGAARATPAPATRPGAARIPARYDDRGAHAPAHR